jgi:hypothetical protein
MSPSGPTPDAESVPDLEELSLEELARRCVPEGTPTGIAFFDAAKARSKGTATPEQEALLRAVAKTDAWKSLRSRMDEALKPIWKPQMKKKLQKAFVRHCVAQARRRRHAVGVGSSARRTRGCPGRRQGSRRASVTGSSRSSKDPPGEGESEDEHHLVALAAPPSELVRP